MSDINVTITDNSALFKEAKDEAVARALEAIGLQAEGYAKMLAPVDTGFLRNSLTHAVSGEPTAITEYKADKGDGRGSYSGTAPNDPDNQKAVYIGTNVEYATYQELGTRRTIAQPFLKPAVQDHADEYRAIVENELSKG